MASLLTRRRILAAAATVSLIEIGTDLTTVLLVPGGTASRTITLERTNYSGAVTLVASSFPTGVTAEFSAPTLTEDTYTSVLTLTAAADAPTVSADAVAVTASGDDVDDAVLALAVTVTDLSGASHYFRPDADNIELPRGVSSEYDLVFDEATGAVSTVGAGSSYLWDWQSRRVNSVRHLAIPSEKRLTVAGSGSTAYTNFLAAVATFTAGTGDYEILVPATMTMSGGWDAPVGVGMSSRLLFITYVGTLPTADVMPALDAARSVWTGPGSAASYLVRVGSALCPNVTFTGIRLAQQSACNLAIFAIHADSVATVDDVPRKVIIDRCVIDGTGNGETVRGLLANGRELALLESWIIDIRISNEAKAIGAWNGLRHMVCRNVLAEARGIGIVFGGADPAAPNTGTLDPADVFFLNTCTPKKLSWMSEAGGAASGYLKNGFETGKNVRRVFGLNCITFRAANAGQTHAMIVQNLSDDNSNLAENRTDDILFFNHLARDCQNFLNVLSRVAYAQGFCSGTTTGTTLVVNAGYNTLQRDDDVYEGYTLSIIAGAGVGQEREVVAYDGDSRTFELASAFDPAPMAYIDGDSGESKFQINGPPVPEHPASRLAFVNVRLEGLGKNWGRGGYRGNPFQLQSDIQGITLDRWTWLMDTGAEDLLRLEGSGATNPRLLNFAGRAMGLFRGGGATGLTALGLFSASATWAGHAMFGTPMYGGTHTPGLSSYADAAAAGFDEETGVITGAAADDGVDGATPGCDHALLDAGIASMSAWAFSR